MSGIVHVRNVDAFGLSACFVPNKSDRKGCRRFSRSTRRGVEEDERLRFLTVESSFAEPCHKTKTELTGGVIRIQTGSAHTDLPTAMLTFQDVIGRGGRVLSWLVASLPARGKGWESEKNSSSRHFHMGQAAEREVRPAASR